MSPNAHGVQSSTSVHLPARIGSLRCCCCCCRGSSSLDFLPFSFLPVLSDGGSFSPESSAPALALNLRPPPTACNSASPSSVCPFVGSGRDIVRRRRCHVSAFCRVFGPASPMIPPSPTEPAPKTFSAKSDRFSGPMSSVCAAKTSTAALATISTGVGVEPATSGSPTKASSTAWSTSSSWT